MSKKIHKLTEEEHLHTSSSGFSPSKKSFPFSSSWLIKMYMPAKSKIHKMKGKDEERTVTIKEIIYLIELNHSKAP